MSYRIELFEASQLTEIEFFDPHELAQAKERAMSAVDNGPAEHAEVRDDGAALLFRYPRPIRWPSQLRAHSVGYIRRRQMNRRTR